MTSPLEMAGWTRRHTASGAKLLEDLAEYRSLGFEAVAVSVEEAGGEPACSECFKISDSPDRVMVIFTRPAHKN